MDQHLILSSRILDKRIYDEPKKSKRMSDESRRSLKFEEFQTKLENLGDSDPLLHLSRLAFESRKKKKRQTKIEETEKQQNFEETKKQQNFEERMKLQREEREQKLIEFEKRMELLKEEERKKIIELSIELRDNRHTYKWDVGDKEKLMKAILIFAKKDKIYGGQRILEFCDIQYIGCGKFIIIEGGPMGREDQVLITFSINENGEFVKEKDEEAFVEENDEDFF